MLMLVNSSSCERGQRACGMSISGSRGTWGFTLIELFVVIAIIAVLAALLIPVGSRMLENSRKTKCLSNLSSIGKAFHLYMAENDIFPQKSNNQPQDWLFSLKPYLGSNSGVTSCPNAILEGGKPKVFRSTLDTNMVTNYGISYWLAEGMATGGGGVTGKRVPRALNIRSANRVGVLVDANSNWLKDTQASRVRYAHNGVANVLFFDGHVESQTREQLVDNNGNLTCMGSNP